VLDSYRSWMSSPAPLHQLVRKGRYDTIFGRAGDNVCVTLRIIWQNFLRVIWHIGAQFLSDRSPGFQAPLSTSSFGCSLQPVNLNSTVNSDDCCRTALIWETQHTNSTKLGDFARYENVLHESVSPTPKESVDSLGTMLRRSDLHGLRKRITDEPRCSSCRLPIFCI
jgi:hypothetical protein